MTFTKQLMQLKSSALSLNINAIHELIDHPRFLRGLIIYLLRD